MRRKDVRVGDTVIVRRAGDVIPEIVGVVRPSAGRAMLPRSACPTRARSAASAVGARGGRSRLRCTAGLFCPAQRKQAILHFAGAARDGHRGPGREAGRPAGRRRAGEDAAGSLRLGAQDLAGPGAHGRESPPPTSSTAIERSKRDHAAALHLCPRHPQRRRNAPRATWRAFRRPRAPARRRRGSAAARSPTSGRSWRKALRIFFPSRTTAKWSRGCGPPALHSSRSSSRRRQAALAGKTFVLTGTLPKLTRDEAKEEFSRPAARCPAASQKKPITWWRAPIRAASTTRPANSG